MRERAGGEVILYEEIKQDIILLPLLRSINYSSFI